jgi:imidazolonepropionase-like amidohydrolase
MLPQPMKRTLSLLALCLLAGQVFAQTIAVKAGHLVDPETGTVKDNQVIIVENGRIKSVGEGPILAGAEVVDLSKQWVMPGMFDCHTHVCMSVDSEFLGHDALFRYDLYRTGPRRALDAAANCREYLNAGITTIRDVGNSGNYVDSDVRRAIEDGVIDGPTIINAGRIIAPFGGQYFVQPERPDLRAPEYFEADTRDEMTKAIRQNIHFGARVIKIVVDDQRYIYTVDDIKHIVAEAANAGVKVCAHALTERGTRNAIEGGVASIEHGFSMNDETLQMAKEHGTVLVSTDIPPRGWKEYLVPTDQAQDIYTGLIDRLKRAHKIGVTLAFGSDLVFKIPEMDRGQFSLSEVDGYVKAGIPNADTLRALTVNAARLLGVDRTRGFIKATFAADIIAMSANPLDDVQIVRQVKFVMKNGKVYRNDYAK